MGTIESYLTNSYNYIIFNFKKLCIGGLMSAIVGAMSGVTTAFIDLFMERANYDIMHIIMSFLIYFGIIFIIGLIVSAIIGGYNVRIMKTTVEGLNVAPDWNNITDLLYRGILYIVGLVLLNIIFYFIPAILFVFGIFSLYISKIIGAFLIIISILIFIISVISLWLYSKLAEVNYSVKGFYGFFEFKEIFKMIGIRYIILVIIIAIINFIISLIVVLPLNIIDIFISYSALANSILTIIYISIKGISYALSTFVDFYLGVFSIRAVALYYKDRKGIT
ncbi:hypothetical protein MJ_0233 [Methanocaldococcus jannaschii DSM 2661]|uniref:Uncharacterized protein MJ0233 n=1 Tax=Methanocaldococcus jannaschii (strain ATCC 43067 / DSM 2661 / JAL-1 / JCM 10045 / NBRC 100440) TaxID=243232 RepID=Y233_METJA|nr:DUF4013 domain-containing protein [Methanocaldococcus jannaschii]Q57685.1 RecName: Full=Uncharacterized protein MJ0233 [Methanocaldococcus jannaschii DSM 2661]AAB98226.1 hypothetical protein MJ_0233 [Methanocaldococcus jannaschii DSM 2661]